MFRLLPLLLLLTVAAHAASKPDARRGLQPLLLTIPGETRPVTLYGESHALVIGVADYNAGWPRLPGVKDDVEAVVRVLEAQGFTVSKVTNPGSDQLDKAIKQFVFSHGQKKDARLLIYFAGHGYTYKPDAERQLGYLVPVDAPLAERDESGFLYKALSMESMEGYARQIRAKHALFVFDSCFSGAFFKMRAAPEVIALKTTQPVRQFITSGSAEQQVPDVSVFRKEFVAALEGEADLNRDGYVTGSELGSYLEEKVTNYSRQTQTPQYGKIQDRNLDKGDFVFALHRTEPLTPAPQNLGPIAPAAPVGGMSLEAIRKQQELRDGWEQWQARMRTDYEQVDAMNVAPELKATAWEQFLAAYPQTNPYSAEADTLRGQARAALLDAKRQAVRLADGAERAKAANPARSTARQSYEPEMVDIPGKDYAMGKYEVTQAQYQACVDDGGCKPPEWLEAGSQYHIHTGSDDYYKRHLGADRPAVGVSWDNAQSYVQWLTRKTGKRYRLPTESEWKHACDGGGNNEYCGGNNLDALGWYDGNSGGQTHPVGQKQANDYGLYDMTGNVWEWQQDCWEGDCSRRVLRGGSWSYFSESARAAFRYWYTTSARNHYIGFRVARSSRTN